jgi:hypothetical protein
MYVFIGNPTHQHRQFFYRLPEEVQARMLPISAGQQAKFPRDVEGHSLDSLIDQLKSAGGREFNDPRSIDSPFVLLYRMGKPIGEDDLNEAQALDIQQRQETAGDMVEAAGKVAFDAASKQQTKGKIESTSLEVIEEDKGQEVKNGVDFETVVDKKAGKPTRSRRRA